MQPHDHQQVPDAAASRAADGVSTDFAPDTGRRLKWAVCVFAGVLLLGFIGVWIFRFVDGRRLTEAAARADAAPPPVDTVIAQPVKAGITLLLPGQTAAWYEATIYARVEGYVGNWRADLGDHVTKGEILATLETPDLDAQLAAARAQLKASQALVVAREADVAFARTTNARWRDSPKGVVSEQERDAKKADYDTAEARRYAAEAQVALDQARVKQYAAMTQFKQVTAPFDGSVSERRIDVGNLVTAGSTAATMPLYKVIQDDTLRVFVDVPQSAAADLMKTGSPVKVFGVDTARAPILGRIARAAAAVNPEARTMRVEVDIANADHRWIPGLYVNVSFELPPKGLVEVPAAALNFRAGGAEIAKVDADGRVEFRRVTIVRDDGSVVELGSGVQPGERVVLNISSQIVAGQTVKVGASGPP